MIVLDEHLRGAGIGDAIARWYRGAVTDITALRPGSVVKDSALPALLRTAREHTFVTKLIRAMIRSDQMSRSVIFDEIVEEGAVKARRKDIIDVLAERLGAVSADIKAKLESIADQAELSRLLRLAVRCASMDDFRADMDASPAR